MAESNTDPTVTEEEVLENEDVETDEVDEPSGDEELPEEQDGQPEQGLSPSFEKAFTQFKGDTPTEYAKNLEDAYRKSSTEGLRLNAEVKELNSRVSQLMSAVAADPALAAKLNQAAPGVQSPATTPQTDPALDYYRAEFQKRMESEYNEFVDRQPELLSDPALAQQVNERLAAIRNSIMATEHRQIGMKEGLEMSWASLGFQLNESKEEATRMAVKNQASQSRKPGGRPTAPAGRSQFTDEQVEFARRIYPNKNREELEKMLSENLQATQTT